MPKDPARHSICRNARRFRPAAKGAPPAPDGLGLHAVFIIFAEDNRQRPRQRQNDLPQPPTCTIFAVDKPPHGQTPGKPVPHPARIVFVR